MVLGGKKRKNSEEEIIVKVGRTGSKVIDIALNGARSVADALEAAGITKKESEDVRVNGEDVEEDYDLEDGDRVLLVKNIEGGNR
jgi:sulfur carrier protein ThiS